MNSDGVYKTMGNADVLYIEKNTVNCKLITTLVQSLGYKIDTTCDIDEISPQKLQDYALIICEMNASKRQNLCRKNGTPPVLWIVNPQEAIRAAQHDRILIRPVTPPILMRVVNEMLEDILNQNLPRHLFDQPDDIMRCLLNYAREKTRESQDLPFSAAIAYKKRIVAMAQDQSVTRRKPLAKAAVIAIEQACNYDDINLEECDIYLTSEPCALSLAAIYEAGFRRIFYANSMDRLERYGFDLFALYDELGKYNKQRLIPSEILLEQDGEALLSDWSAVLNRNLYVS